MLSKVSSLPDLETARDVSPTNSQSTEPATKPQHKVQRRLLLDVVVRERLALLQLLPRKDQPLLVGRDALLLLDLCLDRVDRVVRLNLQRDCLARQRLDKDLHGIVARPLVKSGR